MRYRNMLQPSLVVLPSCHLERKRSFSSFNAEMICIDLLRYACLEK